MADFPLEMQGDVAVHLHREVLALPIFDMASQGCRKAIAMQIRPMFCAPGEYVLHKGDAISCIYCVCNGSLEVLKEGMVVAILGMWRLHLVILHHFRSEQMRCAKVARRAAE
jgi:potassium voltage-gated channel Eag-related subfamily H protein 8